MRWSLLLFTTACVGGTEVKVGTYNSEPSATILYPGNDAQFNEGEVIEFEARVSDSYDSPEDLEAIWSSDLEGELEAGSLPSVDGSLYYSTANLSVGNHVVSLTVFDTDGASTQTNVQIEIIDLPEQPLISIVHPTSVEEGTEGELFEFVVEVSDARDAAFQAMTPEQ